MKLRPAIPFGLAALLLAAMPTSGFAQAGNSAPPTARVSASPDAQGTRLILLGTSGGPTVHADRSQPGSLLVVNGRSYLFDCGDSTVRQLKKAGFDAADVGRVFLSHLHFDHVGGLSSLLMFNWVSGARQPVEIYGPPGTESLVRSALGYLSLPESIYSLQLPPHPALPDMVHGHDLKVGQPAEAYKDDLVRVTAVENSHYQTLHLEPQGYGVTRSYSYRVDTPDRSIVFTGDTGPSDAVAQLAKGADILVSEVIDIDAVIAYLKTNNKASDAELSSTVTHMRQEHLAPEEVGKLAARAGVKMVVLSHIAPGSVKNTLRFSAGVRRYFKGPVVVGSDLDQF